MTIDFYVGESYSTIEYKKGGTWYKIYTTSTRTRSASSTIHEAPDLESDIQISVNGTYNITNSTLDITFENASGTYIEHHQYIMSNNSYDISSYTWPMIFQDVQKTYLYFSLSSGTVLFTPQEIILSKDNLSDYKYKVIYPTSSQNNQIFLKISPISLPQGIFDITQEQIYLDWTRIPTQEEIDFATIADQIPWLENKLIDFSYFYTHSIINKQQYSELQNTINNELRQVNGKLIFYTNAYYNALHYQTTEMANLLNSLEGLSAIFNSSVIKTYEQQGSITKLQQFENSYNTIFFSTNFLNNKHELLNYDNIYSDYVNKYISAKQRFLKNILAFQEYFNDNISIFRPNSAICEDLITITTKNDNYLYSFNQKNNL
ncbi:MAG: hypothetical protein K5765_01100 [Clostridia bacterium]|nr:hypothetical protein [Clostridia bacterium]